MSTATKRVRSGLVILLAGLLAVAGLGMGSQAQAAPQEMPFDGQTWKYLDDGTNPSPEAPKGWAQPGFDDSAWKSAAGSFGAKRGKLGSLGGGFSPVNLLEQYRPGTTENKETFFFRANVDVDQELLDGAVTVVARMYYDDAASLFVNGSYAGGGDDAELMASENPNKTFGGSNAGTPKLAEVHIQPEMLKAGTNLFAVRVHNGRPESSDVYFDFVGLQKNTERTPSTSNEMMLPGTTALDRAFVWYSALGAGDTKLQIAKAADVAGGDWNEKATIVEPSKSALALAPLNKYNFANVEGLDADAEYSWRVGNDKHGWSEAFTFRTEDPDHLNFFFVGDPQIGSSGDRVRDGEGWQATLDVMTKQFPEINLLVSGGDQVNTGGSEAEYKEFLKPKQLKELAVAPTIGNHDAMSMANYVQHYPVGNEDQTTKNAWYGYGNVLFLHVNSEYRVDYSKHREWMEKVLADQGDNYKYHVVVMHRSLFSTANHSMSGTTIELRDNLAPIFSDLGIDLVLHGHDHVYTRTHLMNGTTPVTSGTPSEVTPKSGEVMYVTANSASGSKHYTIKPGAEPNRIGEDGYTFDERYNFVSVTEQLRVPTFSKVSADECTLTVSTYRADNMDLRDEIKLDIPGTPTMTIPSDATLTQDEVEKIDPTEGIETQACDNANATVRVSNEVKAEAGTYEVKYELVDADGNVIDTQTRTITVEAAPEPEPAACAVAAQTAGVKLVDDPTWLWGSAPECAGEKVTVEVRDGDSWVAVGDAVVGDNGFYKVSLAQVNSRGAHSLRAVIGEGASDEVSLTRVARSTSHVAERSIVGWSSNMWGSVDGKATVSTQVKLPGKGWSTSQTRTVDGGYVIPLTYGKHSAATLTWRAVIHHDNGIVEYTKPVTQQRLVKPTANVAAVSPIGQASNAWGSVDAKTYTRVWTEVRLPDGTWSKSQVRLSDGSGRYVIPLTYGRNSAGSLQWRVAAQYDGVGVVRSDVVTQTRR